MELFIVLRSDIAGKWSPLFMHRMGTAEHREVQQEIIHAASLITSGYLLCVLPQFGASPE